MKMGIVTFSVGSTTYKFKEPLMLESEYIEGMLHLTHKGPILSACGKSWGECQDIYADMKTIYRKMGLSEKEIADRILCKATKVIEGKKGLDKCDELKNEGDGVLR